MDQLNRRLRTRHVLYAPLLNWVILITLVFFIVRLVAIFSAVVFLAPLIVMAVSNILLYALSDALAQTVETVSQNFVASRRLTTLGGSEVSAATVSASAAAELEAGPSSSEKTDIDAASFSRPAPNSRGFFKAASQDYSSKSFQFDRMIRFATWGFVLSTFLFKWLQMLDSWIPITETSVAIPVLLRVIVDQTIWTPAALSGFFAFMSYVEGGGSHAFRHKLATLFVPTLKSNFLLWPAAQIINFRLIPLHFQLPFISTIGVFWNTWLSFTNAHEGDM
ncbi:uncharacterized protein V1518DRAFT_438290 [Limtongia smithiae]|uniref:uncharacterized protein n=1 Tax=Limtongia smithiae TaxID=1125753 RepID=UPI0034CE4A0C